MTSDGLSMMKELMGWRIGQRGILLYLYKLKSVGRWTGVREKKPSTVRQERKVQHR